MDKAHKDDKPPLVRREPSGNMMPTIANACAGGLIAALFFTISGLSLARLALPGPLAVGVAPSLGWAIFSVVALPLLACFGYTPVLAVAFASTFFILSLALLKQPNSGKSDARSLPWWGFAVAGVQALLPAVAIVPKYVNGGVLLGPQMYDHAKVAIIDQIMRQGLPPQNPFFGLAGKRSSLAYYYLWHFSAAVLGSVMHISGWTADIGMTWFTAFAAATLMMALAMYLTGSPRVIWLTVALSLPASVRPIVGLFFSHHGNNLIVPDSDIGGWINQASWVPQHVASGCCAVLSALLIARIAESGSWLAAFALACTVAAGFESSAWVGGVAFALAALAAAPLLMRKMTTQERRRFAALTGVSAILAAATVAPFCLQQAADMASKAVGLPVAFGPYQALGSLFPRSHRSIANLLAFWPLILPFNFPTLFPVGVLGYVYALNRSGASGRDPVVLVLTCFAIACLTVTWLARSTIDNNDLGWRAVIPSILILTGFAAATWSRWLASDIGAGVAAALVLAAAGLPQGAIQLKQNFAGQQPADAAGFARSLTLWNEVRKFAGPADRVGNNPQFLASLTPWPDNISWALLSNRPSCYSGWSTAIAYTDLPRAELKQIDGVFRRVFAGDPESRDVENLAFLYDCEIIVVTPADGAWFHDPFTDAPAYKLAEQHGDQWKIYQLRSSQFITEPEQAEPADRWQNAGNSNARWSKVW